MEEQKSQIEEKLKIQKGQGFGLRLSISRWPCWLIPNTDCMEVYNCQLHKYIRQSYHLDLALEESQNPKIEIDGRQLFGI